MAQGKALGQGKGWRREGEARGAPYDSTSEGTETMMTMATAAGAAAAAAGTVAAATGERATRAIAAEAVALAAESPFSR